MKFLFELLDESASESLLARVVQSLDQIVCVQYLSDADAPPGIMNFGLPHASDAARGEELGALYAAQVAARIQQFEPRLDQVQVECKGGRVLVRARLLGVEGEDDFRWAMDASASSSAAKQGSRDARE